MTQRSGVDTLGTDAQNQNDKFANALALARARALARATANANDNPPINEPAPVPFAETDKEHDKDRDFHPVKEQGVPAGFFPIEKRVLGVDPGLGVTGYAVIEPWRGTAAGAALRSDHNQRRVGPFVVEAGVIRASRQGGAFETRLKILHLGILEILDMFRPEALALEQVHSHSKHPRTAILMAHARGVIMLAAGLRGVNVVGYAASRIKKTLTGSGRAPKEQMQHAVRVELGLSQLPEPHDVADACAVALCHYQTAYGIGWHAGSANPAIKSLGIPQHLLMQNHAEPFRKGTNAP